VGVILDITEHKRLEGELRRLNETLAEQVETEVTARIAVQEEKKAQEELLLQQSKMAAMGEMIGAIAHQWNQPLNVIALIVQNFAEDYRDGEVDEKQVEKLENQLIEQVRFMSQTMNDFRNFFKPSKEKTVFAACESAGSVAKLLKPQFDKHRVTVTIHPHEHFQVNGYPNEFKQVVLNILNNARDVFEEKKQAGQIDLLFEHDEAYGTIRIRDNGGGVPETLLPEKLFEPYVTTKGEKGTGIGLQICKTIIEKNMGGNLSVQNVENGAEFVIRLPLFK